MKKSLELELPATRMNNGGGSGWIRTTVTGLAEKKESLLSSTNESTIRTIMENSPDGMVISGLDGMIRNLPVKTANMLGHKSPDEIMGRNILEFIHPSYHRKAIYFLNEMMNGNMTGATEYLMVKKDKSAIYCETNANILRDEDDNPAGVLYVVRDITGRRQAESALRESEERHRALFMESPDAYLIMMDGIYTDCNQASESMMRGDRTMIIGKSPQQLSPECQPDGKPSSLSASERIDEACRTGKTTFEWAHRRFDGSVFTVEISMASIMLNGTSALFIALREITERKRMETEFRRLATTDQLTSLYNRYHINQVFIEEKKRVDRYGLGLSVIMVDIDKFKAVNDEYGHQVGDMVLTEMADIFRKGVRESDILGRWGGEEFFIVCPNTELGGAATLAEKLKRKIESSDFGAAGRRTCSFGVAQLAREEAIDSWIARVDTALYRAKEGGRNRVVSDS